MSGDESWDSPRVRGAREVAAPEDPAAALDATPAARQAFGAFSGSSAVGGNSG